VLDLIGETDEPVLVMDLPQIQARIQRLEALARGLAEEDKLWRNGEDPLTDSHIGLPPQRLPHSFQSVGGLLDLEAVPLQQKTERGSAVGVVLDHQHPAAFGGSVPAAGPRHAGGSGAVALVHHRLRMGSRGGLRPALLGRPVPRRCGWSESLA
jgi:hypothetical protein